MRTAPSRLAAATLTGVAIALVTACSASSAGSQASTSTAAARVSAKATPTLGDAPSASSGADDQGQWYVPPQVKELPDDGSVRIVESEKVTPPTSGFAKATGAAQFVTPGGGIGCTLAAGAITCSLPEKLLKSLPEAPDPASYCSSSTVVKGVRVGEKGNAYLCGSMPAALAVPGTPDTAWAGSGAATAQTESGPAVVLPDERGVALGTLQCISREGGVTCASTGVGSGFTITRTGVSFFGTAPGTHNQYD